MSPKRKISAKRKIPPESEDQTHKSPRQFPANCELCRKRKQKCDRRVPCSNCAQRGMDCVYSDPGHPALSIASISELSQSHLREQTLLDNRAVSGRPGAFPATPTPGVRQHDDSSATADRLETILMGHRFPYTTTGSPGTDAPDSDRSCPAVVDEEPAASSGKDLTSDLVAELPSESDAMALLEYYHQHLSYQYHIAIHSSTRQQFKDVYTSVVRSQPLNMGDLALVFAITAVSLFFQLLTPGEAKYGDMSGEDMAHLAGITLKRSNYISHPTMAGLQAALIIGHYFPNDALSPAVNLFFAHSTSINVAKSLGLHMLDSAKAVEERKKLPYDKRRLEVKRRMWWDIASYDWLIGFLSGPQEFTYTIQPKHMKVNLPLNIEDEDIETGQEAPISTPTCMSYSLTRIKLSELCREIVDELAPFYMNGEEPPYETIIKLDDKWRDEHTAMPSIFRFDQTSKRQYANLYLERPSFAWQRSLAEQGWQTRRCRLHRQWLVRGAKEPRYSYSHVVALQSARTVLEVKRVMDEEEPVFAPTSALFWAVMHHVFIASVILLMDVCFNWNDILAEKRKQEVLDACRMLSRAQQVSPVAREGINAMMGVMRKHWKHDISTAGNQDLSVIPNNTASPNVQLAISDQEAYTSSGSLRPPTVDPGSLPLFSMEDTWSAMLDGNAGVGLDTPEWMNMLSELGISAMPSE